ncbi:hypothetical protein [Campylobacter sp.]|uniref:hypothetical protein n=1 Tax=Campylobacter sp. TaxID=205 RepID=UPI0025C59647|nr:hypothetical protein [Campylobacter sp.]
MNGKQVVLRTTYNNKTKESSPVLINLKLRQIVELTISGKGNFIEGEDISLSSSFKLNFGNPNDIPSDQIKYQ